jgi:nucleotide-binding universal stress UspA family protein
VTELLSTVLMPVASEADAGATARAVERHLPSETQVHAVHVIEKAGGAPDKASVEQREEFAEAAFERVRDVLGDGRVTTHVRYGTDVADAIFAAADELGADTVVFTPRDGSRWIRLLTGDVALDLVTETDRPVLVLPDVEER